MPQFRDQYVVEGLVVAGLYLLFSFAIIFGIEMALAVDSDVPLYQRFWYLITCRKYARPIYMLNTAADETCTDYVDIKPSESKANIGARIISYLIFGVVIPLVIVAATIYVYFLIVRIYTVKNSGYSSHVLWTHRVISSFLNQGLRKMGIPFEIPGLLYSEYRK